MDNRTTVVYIACPYTKGDVAVNVRESIIAADKLRALEIGEAVTHWIPLPQPPEVNNEMLPIRIKTEDDCKNCEYYRLENSNARSNDYD